MATVQLSCANRTSRDCNAHDLHQKRTPMIGLALMVAATGFSFKAASQSASRGPSTAHYALGAIILISILLAPFIPLIISCVGAGLIGWGLRKEDNTKLAALIAGGVLLLVAWGPLVFLLTASVL